MSDEVCLDAAFSEDDSIEDLLNQEYNKGFVEGYQQGKSDEQLQSIEDAKMQATEYLNALDKAKEEAYQQGAMALAEWLEYNSYLNWVGEGNDVNSISAKEVLAEWEGAENE